jgi:acyl-CoA reductase-like NAD-dependent aldehyde dehydrogenase
MKFIFSPLILKMNMTDQFVNLFPEEKDIPEQFKLAGELHQKEILINGEMIPWNGKVNQVYSPIYIKKGKEYEQKLLGSVPVAGVEEAQKALDAAVKAYNNGRGEWPTMTIAERITCMEHFTNLMIQKKNEIVKLLMWEIGKTHSDSVKEFDRTVEYIFKTIDSLKDLDRDSSRFTIEEGIIAQIRRAPLGVVLCMGPFNYPLNETYTTLIPALLMGNTVCFKPPKHGILLHYPLMEAFQKAFPKGVLNMVYGKGDQVIPPLMGSGKINVLTLIGSSKVADSLKKMHPKVNRLRAVLGLDAKNAGIILKDADLDVAVKECLLGTLSFNGQRCTALKILFVDRSIAHQFIQKFNEALEKQKFGMPWEKDVMFTPLPEPGKPEYLKKCIDDAIGNGAKVVNPNGGAQFKSFAYPAVLYPVNDKMICYKEEQFGPIIPIVPFSDIEEPVEYLINSEHGQQVSIFGTDRRKVAHLIDPLVNQVCRVNINCQCQRGPDTFPFTGRKDSAEGTLSVFDAIRSFSVRTLVAAKETNVNKEIINDIVEEGESKFLSTRFIF